MSRIESSRCPVCQKSELRLYIEAPIAYAKFSAIIENGKLVCASPPNVEWILRRGSELTFQLGVLTCADCGFAGNPQDFAMVPFDGRIEDEGTELHPADVVRIRAEAPSISPTFIEETFDDEENSDDEGDDDDEPY
jgi:hypothetical protein